MSSSVNDEIRLKRFTRKAFYTVALLTGARRAPLESAFGGSAQKYPQFLYICPRTLFICCIRIFLGIITNGYLEAQVKYFFKFAAGEITAGFPFIQSLHVLRLLPHATQGQAITTGGSVLTGRQNLATTLIIRGLENFAVKTRSQRPQPKLHKYRPGRPGGAGKIRNHHIIHRRVECLTRIRQHVP